ncbi:hypothetical protein TVAG_101340 [Trichomonas vaginalis G3]|uniref:Nucleoplasmin-like domain-containing protein n=1 Tax=Trichomonas vaginalis (strain ATCC PRA-98 / G3) TaxID=412133 RepID=A2DJL6_TRIV3|nr:hypothetical protein TVAGG3_1035800 [Trichomonas vaginalis G3]EAY19416.1 hypothetical protein TVAG_101340 [Trichomonas vaginalis G3]KAI5493186.1 hypothetical protein TVAGG3_1035800 [Trichomonas vaginalis G3]|eukprot:XP_001580402.1 hypothetical protein [Trichomonas vaginalis G3]
MTSIFRLTVNSGQTVPIEFKEYMMVTISKGILMVRPDQTRPVLVTIKYMDLQDNKEKSEKLCVFDPGQTDVVIENLYYDTQRPTITVPEGATVKFEGVFTSSEEFADHDEEENSSSEAQDDEEDDDFQAEESE